MSDEVFCQKCQSANTYFDGNLQVCSECFFEWNPNGKVVSEENHVIVIKDAFGNVLNDGDSVTVIKDLKVKGASSSVKVGTKVRGIRLAESSDGHNIDCKIDGFGAMRLKSEFVKKV